MAQNSWQQSKKLLIKIIAEILRFFAGNQTVTKRPIEFSLTSKRSHSFVESLLNWTGNRLSAA